MRSKTLSMVCHKSNETLFQLTSKSALLDDLDLVEGEVELVEVFKREQRFTGNIVQRVPRHIQPEKVPAKASMREKEKKTMVGPTNANYWKYLEGSDLSELIPISGQRKTSNVDWPLLLPVLYLQSIQLMPKPDQIKIYLSTYITDVLIHCCSCPFETFVDLGISCCLMVNWIFIGMPATVVTMLLHKLFQLLLQMLDMPPHAKGSNWVLPKRFQWQWQGNQVKLWQTFLFILENLSLMWLLGPCLSLVTVNDCQCLLLF